ncbi:MAG: phage tail protein I [Pseudomonadota bacterium]
MADHLLPPSATELLRQLSLAAERATSLPVEIRDEWSPQRCASHMLPWLAWAFGVEEWDVTWTDAQKRAAITSALAIKRTKGTIGAVVSTVEGMGLGAQVVEWFNQEPAGAPYTYDLIVTAEQAGFTQQQLDLLLALIERTKNVRSHLDELLLQVQSRTTLYTAGAPLLGFDITLAYEGDVVATPPLVLIHFDVEAPGGGPGDDSPYMWSTAFFGDAGIDFFDGRFGGSCLMGGLGGGTVVYIGGVELPPPDIGTGPFTVEFFVRPAIDGKPGAQYFISGGTQLLGSLWIANDQQAGQNRLEVRHYDGDTELLVIAASAATVVPAGQWTHVALVRAGDQFTLYLDGQQAATAVHTGLYLSLYDILLGGDGTAALSLEGNLDEVRVTPSAVYTANFAPPTAPFN